MMMVHLIPLDNFVPIKTKIIFIEREGERETVDYERANDSAEINLINLFLN